MSNAITTVEEYLATVPDERRPHFDRLRATILDHLPEGFVETIQYGMIAYVVPLDIYPDGYHVKKGTPLPFVSIASQKNFIGLYHMGIYTNEDLLNWFTAAYPQHSKRKLDMGKSCIRFKKMEAIPYELLGTLMQKVTVQEWIQQYEQALKR